MNQISAKLAELLLGSGDHTGNLGPLVGQRRHDVTFHHYHPRSQNDRGDYLLQADMMSAMRLVCVRHDTGVSRVGTEPDDRRPGRRPELKLCGVSAPGSLPTVRI